MIIKVITIELATGKTHDERTTRLNTEAGQRWLHKHMTFAFSNGYGVQMLNQDDSEPVAETYRVEPKSACSCLGMPGTNDCKIHA